MTDIKLDVAPPIGNPEYLKPPKNIFGEDEKGYRQFTREEKASLQRKIDIQYLKAFPPLEPPEKLVTSSSPLPPPERLEVTGHQARKKKKWLAAPVLRRAAVGILINALGILASGSESNSLKTVAMPIDEPAKIAAPVDKPAAVLAGTATVDVSRAIKAQEIVKGISRQYFDAAMFAQEKTGIPRSVILGIFRQESSMGTDPNLATSKDLGPAQIRPATWVTVSERVGKATGEKPNPNNPKHAALAAALHLLDSGFRENGQKAIRIYHRGTGHWQDNLGKDYFEKIVGYTVPFEEALQNAGF